MDPNLFHLDWDRTAEVLAAVVIMSLVVERFLSIFFESRWFMTKFDAKNMKEMIALGFSFIVCLVWDFDAVSMIVVADNTNPFGCLVTAGVIAGGSKGSIKLFRDFLGFRSTARKEKDIEEEAKLGKLKAASAPNPNTPGPTSPEPVVAVETGTTSPPAATRGKRKAKKKSSGGEE